MLNNTCDKVYIMLLDRRHVLKAGTAAMLGTAVAGCLGDDPDDEPAEPGEPRELAIEHVRLLTEQPADYRDYEEESDNEIAVVAGAYAGVIDVGLSAELFRGLVEDGDGTELSYRIETETARQYAEGDLSEAEYLEKVFGTLRPRE